MSIRSYQDLEVWKKAVRLVKTSYDLVAGFPSNERYGLISQIQRCAVSVPANIAEGRGRSSKKEFLYFLKIASSSLAELETHFFVAIEIGYLAPDTCKIFFDTASEVGKMLNGLMYSLRDKTLEPGTRNLEPA